MEYKYLNVKIDDLAIVATKISRLIGVMPSGLSDSGDSTNIFFTAELTPAQKTALDTFMTETNLDVIQTTTNTVYTLADMDGIKAITGLDFDMYPTKTGLTIVFQKVLTAQEKNTFRGAVANLLVVT